MPLDVSSLASYLRAPCVHGVWAPRRGVEITFNNLIGFEDFSHVRSSKLPWSNAAVNRKHTMDPPLPRVFHKFT